MLWVGCPSPRVTRWAWGLGWGWRTALEQAVSVAGGRQPTCVSVRARAHTLCVCVCEYACECAYGCTMPCASECACTCVLSPRGLPAGACAVARWASFLPAWRSDAGGLQGEGVLQLSSQSGDRVNQFWPRGPVLGARPREPRQRPGRTLLVDILGDLLGVPASPHYQRGGPHGQVQAEPQAGRPGSWMGARHLDHLLSALMWQAGTRGLRERRRLPGRWTRSDLSRICSIGRPEGIAQMLADGVPGRLGGHAPTHDSPGRSEEAG
ncbi:uncharacterized protein LOC111557568 [Felis catus]|uniref:uncharacterized protein LOC111557568 n=1 Tax=Felis catus TaxID=9685 RepID=UPI001D1A0746|nr:uncharacterized protein LOC111557568 [Felis catus]